MRLGPIDQKPYTSIEVTPHVMLRDWGRMQAIPALLMSNQMFSAYPYRALSWHTHSTATSGDPVSSYLILPGSGAFCKC
jgi:hypothetical protein